MNGRKRNLIVLALLIIVIWGIYVFFNGGVFAYCRDAYTRAHIVEIAPRVEGHLKTVLVKNNQYVKKGDLLMEVEPRTYQLILDTKTASLKQQKAEVEIIKDKQTMAADELKVIKNQYDLAQKKLDRYDKLKDSSISEQQFENIQSDFDTVKNKLTAGEESLQYLQQSAIVQQIIIDATASEVALAEYRLSLCQIKAPTDGYIVNINVRPGDYAAQGDAMFGILDDSEWWLEANFKEHRLNKIKPGQKAWIISDLYPGRMFKGEVVNISRAISRTPGETKLVPYIQPTTDWVRLQRRFEVRVKLFDVPEDIELRMGANARVFVRL